MLFQGLQSLLPLHAVELAPVVEPAQRLGAEAVEPPPRISSRLDRSGIAEHPKMSGHRGLVHADQFDQITDGALPVEHRIQDVATDALSDRVQYGRHHALTSMQ